MKEENKNIEQEKDVNDIDVSGIKYTVDDDLNIYINGELKFKQTEIIKQGNKTEIRYENR